MINLDRKMLNSAKKWIYEEDNWKSKLVFQGYLQYLERKKKQRDLFGSQKDMPFLSSDENPMYGL